jgi:hypothetical protein
VSISNSSVSHESLTAYEEGNVAETSPVLFIPMINERNRKDSLYNRIILFFNSSSVAILEEEMPLGIKLVTLLRDIFWYLDGHHHVFERVRCPISAVFGSFTGYNVPELSKHRKRLTRNISADVLCDFAISLSLILNENYWERNHWMNIKQHFLDLCSSLSSYSDYLVSKNKKSKENHKSSTAIREFSEHLHLKFLSPSSSMCLPSSLQAIDDLVLNLPTYTYTQIDDLLPANSLQKCRLMNLLNSTGLSCPSMLLTYSPGGSIANLHSIWQLPQEHDPTVYFDKSQSQVEEIKKVLPQIHTRAMRKAMFRKFGHISSGVKPSALRYFYRELTGMILNLLHLFIIYMYNLGDCAAPSTTDESTIDKRIQALIDMEDPDIVADLRSLNGSHSSRFDIFWDHCQRYLNEQFESAVDDRRHGNVTHLARAISIRDFISQVKSLCPEGTDIPSKEWVRLQFWPKTPSAKVSLHIQSALN